MQTLKTAIIVVLLLVVFYGVYEMLNTPPAKEPPSVAELTPDATAELDIDMGSESGGPAVSTGESLPSGPPDQSRFAPSEPFAAPSSDGASSSGAPSGGQAGPRDQGMTESPSGPPASGASPHYGSQWPPKTEASGNNTAGSAADRFGIEPGRSTGESAPQTEGSPASSSRPMQPETAGPPAAGEDGSRAPDYTDAGSNATDARAPNLQNNPYIQGRSQGKTASRSSEGRTKRESERIGEQAYERARTRAKSLIAEGDYHDALSALSVFYQSPDLTAEQHRELLDLLDPLAARVIYSRDHSLEDPYVVGRNETLMDIAEQYHVPYQLLQKINGIEDPKVLLPGSELKVVPGPFRADVDLNNQELTLFLGELYAGRFPITLGSDPKPKQGKFQVRDKQHDKTYFSLNGRTIPGNSPANPFGGVWVDLGQEVCIHGSAEQKAGEKQGCISLSPQDADDVYSILSVGSKVRVLR